MNRNKISITTDLDEKYKPIIEELGFKHQWCLFHALKSFNKNIKKYIRENKLNDNEIDKIQEEKLELFSLFESKSLKMLETKWTKFQIKSSIIQRLFNQLSVILWFLTLKRSLHS